MRRWWWSIAAAVLVAASAVTAAQVGGKPLRGGNPTPGTPQPDPPNVSDRITLTGCLQPSTGRAAEPVDANTPSAARFVLTSAKRVERLPPGTGGSALAQRASGTTYRLEGIDSQFSPFVNTRVEMSGEIKPRGNAGDAPTVLVEFIQKIQNRC